MNHKQGPHVTLVRPNVKSVIVRFRGNGLNMTVTAALVSTGSAAGVWTKRQNNKSWTVSIFQRPLCDHLFDEFPNTIIYPSTTFARVPNIIYNHIMAEKTWQLIFFVYFIQKAQVQTPPELIWCVCNTLYLIMLINKCFNNFCRFT